MENALNLVTSFSGKLLKIVATKCYILRRICTKFDFGWGSAPDPAGGAYIIIIIIMNILTWPK